MKVRLITRKGVHSPGEVVDYDDASAQWLVSKGYAEALPETKKAAAETDDAAPPAPRRGRPPKAR